MGICRELALLAVGRCHLALVQPILETVGHMPLHVLVQHGRTLGHVLAPVEGAFARGLTGNVMGECKNLDAPKSMLSGSAI